METVHDFYILIVDRSYSNVVKVQLLIINDKKKHEQKDKMRSIRI